MTIALVAAANFLICSFMHVQVKGTAHGGRIVDGHYFVYDARMSETGYSEVSKFTYEWLLWQERSLWVSFAAAFIAAVALSLCQGNEQQLSSALAQDKPSGTSSGFDEIAR